MTDLDLDYCTTCGGRLELVDGTDPDVASKTGQWSESYRCTLCGGTGTYTVDETTAGITERGTGVVSV